MPTNAQIGTDLSTLTRIQTKVRRLTASPSENQLSTSEINDYVNTFYIFDVPEQLKFFSLREKYEFYTSPNVEQYAFDRNLFINVYQPVYIAGYQSFYSQSREQFYRIYPQLQFIQEVGVGDGSTSSFSFTLSNVPVLPAQNYPPSEKVYPQVTISSADISNNPIIASDDGSGGFTGNVISGSINYLTGVTTVTFSSPPAAGVSVSAQSIPYQPSRPQALLFFDDSFILRPVPDKVYQVSLEGLVRPTAFLASDNSIPNNPQLEEWWQYLAYGAAKKILEDRQDMTSLANIMPGFKEQELFCLRRTTQQLVQERTATIYTEQTQFPYGNFFNRF